MIKVLKALIAKVPKYCMSNPENSFLAKNISKERIDSVKVFRIFPKYERRNSEKHRMQLNSMNKLNPF